MAYIAKRPIMMQSTGKSWRQGQSIGTDEIPLDLRKQMLAEGVIEQVPEKKAGKRSGSSRSKNKEEKAVEEKAETVEVAVD